MSDSPVQVVPVDIHGQRYPIRSTLDAEYVTALATYVDEKMRAAADATTAGDSLRLAVLAAINIADEFFRCREAERGALAPLIERVLQIERLVDQALAS